VPGRWNWIWLVLAFLTELVALVVLARWGWTLGDATPVRLLLAIAVPAVAAVLWGLFAAPRAVVRSRPAAVAVKVLVLGGAAAALLALGRPLLAAVFAVAAALGALLGVPPAELTDRRPG
jgi:hypothetical protein